MKEGIKMFEKAVDTRSKKEMVDFLKNHFRYATANSWNCSTSYANCVKLYHLDIPANQRDKFFDLIATDFYYADIVSPLIDEFATSHNWSWQVGFNGRSNGYLVLYQGFAKESGYKSYCLECGQRNYQSISEKSHTCGVCGGERKNFVKQPLEIGVFPMKSTDMGEDFSEWSVAELRNRVKLVTEFDRLCDRIREATIKCLEVTDFTDEVVYIPKVVKVAKRNG